MGKKVVFIESNSNDPRFNLALEQYIFDQMPRNRSYLMLWRNDQTIVVGKHQDTFAEINADYVRANQIQVVRRLSGGGAVYHDLGNVNFTFIADHTGSDFDFSTFCRPVIWALESLGVPAELNGRNDMTIRGRKFSGNSQYVKEGRVMHHGTLLYDSDLSVVSSALAPIRDKLTSKGLPSVRSRVTNIKPYVNDPQMTVEDFWAALRERMFRCFSMRKYQLSPQELEQVEELRERIYSQWEWNYGHSPACSIRKERRVEGCGTLQIHMDVEKGNITRLAFRGDYFARKDSDALAEYLQGTPLEEGALRQALKDWPVEDYFVRMDLDTFVSAMLQ